MSPRGTVTNLALQTTDITVSPWVVDTVTTADYAGPFPVGGPQAMKVITDTAAVQSHRVYQPRTGIIAVGTPVIASFYFVRVSGSNAVLLACNGAAFYLAVDPATGNFSALSGAVGTAGIMSRNIESLGGGLYRASVLYSTNANDAFLQFYMNNGVSVTYGNGGSPTSIAVGGLMLEIAAPGQTTPSPYVASGATAGVGRRETRQNGLSYSRAFSKWTATAGVTAIDNTTDVLDPKGGNTASKFVYAGGGAAGSYRLYCNSAMPPVGGGPFTISVWLRTASGTVALRLANNQSLGSIVVTPTWQRFNLSVAWPSSGVAQQFLFYSENADNTPFTVYAWEAQSERANTPGGNITTGGAPANANGAPRSLVI